MTPSAPRTVHVVGGGIAGLSAAWRLQQRGITVRVFEREPEAGGRMRTVTQDGYRIELGASILGTNYTRMLALIKELGIADQWGRARAECGFWRDGQVHRLRADSLTDFVRTPLIGLRSKLSLARVLPTLIRNRKYLDWDTTDRNTELDQVSASDYTLDRLTPEIHDILCEPLFGGGIVLGDPAELAAADMFFYAAKLLVPHFNSAQGVGLLTRTLAERLPVTCDATVTAVHTTDRGTALTWSHHGVPQPDEHADAVIVALPAPHVPSVLPQLPDEDAAYLRSVPYSRGLVVSYGLSRRPAEPSPTVFTARATHPQIAGIELHHNKIAHRVEAGQGLITVHPRKEFTDRWWDKDDTAITQELLNAAATILPGIASSVTTTLISRRDPALVVRPVGGYAALRTFNARRRTADPRIQLAGDYFGPSSTYGALLSGEHAADRTLDHLTAP
ncbi:protoporphyrinogen/coproporphyrinogen oxidase [Kitasatospora sp. LaBMicrA B282]|uniref:protoporphyrinogen/coproporphyrinogen oxidase n=1 Tax=Kitasatospora sp. LaBMicrA B282 TaxID=3420949 RepID=UPI003D113DEF